MRRWRRGVELRDAFGRDSVGFDLGFPDSVQVPIDGVWAPGKNVLLEIFFLGRMYDLQRLVLDHSRIISRLPVWFVRVHFHVGPVSFVDM
jgi:hypothetical protein